MKSFFCYTLSAFSLILFLCSCGGSSSDYNIEGRISDSTLIDHNVILTGVFSESSLDTTVINSDGTFDFKGQLTSEDPMLVRLDVEYSEVATVLVLEKGKIKIDIELVDGSYITKVNGTPLNDELTLMSDKCRIYRDTFMSKMDSIESVSFISDDERLQAQSGYIYDYTASFSEVCDEFFTRNPNNVVGLFSVLNWASLDQNLNLDSLLQCAGDVIKNNEYLQQLVIVANQRSSTAEGHPYTNLTGVDSTGSEVSLSDYVGKGKLVLVDFWASWCAPCRAEIPNIAVVANKYSKDLTVVGLNVWDNLEEFKKACQEEKISWPQIVDTTGKQFTELYGIDVIPMIMLIDRNGTIVARNLRGASIEEAIKKSL